MEIKARIKGIEPNIFEKGSTVHLNVEDADMGLLDALKGDLRVTLVKWRERRSLNANAYFHCLSDKLADALRMSKPMCKNYLLFTYGQKWRDESGNLICIKTNAPRKSVLENKDFHAWEIKPSPDGTPMYALLKHSSDYDTKEMSILIDGVVQECKDQGIETMTPNEIRELKERWNVDLQKSGE